MDFDFFAIAKPGADVVDLSKALDEVELIETVAGWGDPTKDPRYIGTCGTHTSGPTFIIISLYPLFNALSLQILSNWDELHSMFLPRPV